MQLTSSLPEMYDVYSIPYAVAFGLNSMTQKKIIRKALRIFENTYNLSSSIDLLREKFFYIQEKHNMIKYVAASRKCTCCELSILEKPIAAYS
jgi:hypothetical protein